MNAPVSFPAFDISAATEVIDLSYLYLSPLNPRQDADPEGDTLLAQSLVACGLVQNLVGLRDTEGRVGIVAGGRRLRALNIAVRERPDLAAVRVMLAPDEDAAVRWATAENVARVDMEPADEIAAYDRTRKAGASVSEIASAFAVTEAHVYRRLKLASLPEVVLAALKAKQINLSQAEAFTVCDDVEKATEVLEAVIRYSHSADRIRGALKHQAVEATDRKARFVGLEKYQNGGGTISKDLFEDTVYLDDPDILDQLFDEKLGALADEKRLEGWSWVEVCTKCQFYSWEHPYTQLPLDPIGHTAEQAARVAELEDLLDEHSELPDDLDDELRSLRQLARKQRAATAEEMAVAGVVIGVNHKGEIYFDGPYIRPQESQQALEAGVIRSLSKRTEASASEKTRPMFSQAVKSDIAAVSLHAMQSRLRQNPMLALRLLAFSLSDASGGSSLFGWRVERPMNVPSEASGLTPDPTLLFEGNGYERVDDLEDAFSTFSQLTDGEVIEAVASGAARTIHGNFGHSAEGAGLFESICKALNVSERDIWVPTKASFWGRMPAAYIEDKFKVLTGLAEDSTELQSFMKQKKGEKAGCMERLFSDRAYQDGLKLTPEQIDEINCWMPDPEE